MEKFLIAGGNSTLLVWGCPMGKRSKIIKKYLGEVEQVGFISQFRNRVPKLTMMGNELSINGTLAFAKVLENNGKLRTSGFDGIIDFNNFRKLTSITLRIPFRQEKNIILFYGIGYILTETKILRKNNYLNDLNHLSDKYRLPAFGYVIYKENKIIPCVYVKKTNSLIAETACGSASLALNITTGQQTIIQPTGQVINIYRNGNQFTIQANVVTME